MEEKSNKEMFAMIVGMIGLIASAFFIFMGFLYVMKGSLGIPVFMAILSVIIFIALQTLLVKFKKQKDRTKGIKPELILFAIYFVLFLVTFPLAFQYFDIEFARKNEIKTLGLEKINKLKKLRADYLTAVDDKVKNIEDSANINLKLFFAAKGTNSATKFKDKLQKILGSNSIDFTKSDADIKYQVGVFVKSTSTARRNLWLDTELQKLNLEVYDPYQEEASNTFENWKLLKISFYYYDIDKMYNAYIDVVKRKMGDFNSTKLDNTTELKIDNAFYSLSNASIVKLIGFFLVYAIVHACILLIYIFTPRYLDKLIYKNGKNKKDQDNGSLANKF